MESQNPTKKQHFTPRFRFRYFEKNKLHYEFSKDGKFIRKCGIGKGIATRNNLYEPIANEYAINEVETDLFANDIEQKQKCLIDNIIKTVNGRNVINYRGYIGNGCILPTGFNDYNALTSLLNISLFRQPFMVDSMNKEELNKFDFFRYIDYMPDNRFCVIVIHYVTDNSEFILSDTGIVYGTDIDTGMAEIFVPLTPNICIQQTLFTEQLRFNGDERNPVLLEPVEQKYVRWVNQRSIEQCEQKFISHTRDYIV